MDRGSKIQSLDREMYPRGWRHPYFALVRPKKSSEHFTWGPCGDRKVARLFKSLGCFLALQAKLAEERRRDRVQRMNRVEACTRKGEGMLWCFPMLINKLMI